MTTYDNNMTPYACWPTLLSCHCGCLVLPSSLTRNAASIRAQTRASVLWRRRAAAPSFICIILNGDCDPQYPAIIILRRQHIRTWPGTRPLRTETRIAGAPALTAPAAVCAFFCAISLSGVPVCGDARIGRDGFKNNICMNTFMINVKPPTLYLNMTST